MRVTLLLIWLLVPMLAFANPVLSLIHQTAALNIGAPVLGRGTALSEWKTVTDIFQVSVRASAGRAFIEGQHEAVQINTPVRLELTLFADNVPPGEQPYDLRTKKWHPDAINKSIWITARTETTHGSTWVAKGGADFALNVPLIGEVGLSTTVGKGHSFANGFGLSEIITITDRDWNKNTEEPKIPALYEMAINSLLGTEDKPGPLRSNIRQLVQSGSIHAVLNPPSTPPPARNNWEESGSCSFWAYTGGASVAQLRCNSCMRSAESNCQNEDANGFRYSNCQISIVSGRWIRGETTHTNLDGSTHIAHHRSAACNLPVSASAVQWSVFGEWTCSCRKTPLGELRRPANPNQH